MGIEQETVPLGRLLIVFGALLIAGTALTIPLYKFDYHRFVRSSLFVKILFWIPIFAVFLAVLYLSSLGRLIVLLILLGLAFRELIIGGRWRLDKLILVYYLFFAAGLLHFCLIATSYNHRFINLLITLTFATVLSDVVAFFFGRYLGTHKLPSFLNPNKSWEGVFGEVLGALAGVLLVNAYIEPVVTLWIFLPIGIGSAIGDLVNSYFKRRIGIKDWSNAIPGHGGFIDRLSSLAGSVLLTFYFLKVAGIT